MSPNEEKLLRGLKALAASETAVPPDALEVRLRERLRKKRQGFYWPLILEAVAAAAILAIALFSPPKEPVQANFIPVPYAAPLGPNERSALVRVSMPVSVLAQWGLAAIPANSNQRIDADVVIGEDGLARAIRLTDR